MTARNQDQHHGSQEHGQDDGQVGGSGKHASGGPPLAEDRSVVAQAPSPGSPSSVSRREFVRRAGATAVATVATTSLGLYFHDREVTVGGTTPDRAGSGVGRAANPPHLPRLPDYRRELPPRSAAAAHLVAVGRGPSPRRNTAAAIDGAGGIAAFVRRGDRVVIKPNASWDRIPEQAANTHPEVVAEVVRQCRAAGASRVVVTDVPVANAGAAFARSGISEAAQRAGAEVLLPSAADFVEVWLGGDALPSWSVLRVLLEADRLIGVPVVKHHRLTGVTATLKNWFGILGGMRGRLHQQVDSAIVDIAAAARPTMLVLDATRVLFQNGPTGGRLADVRSEQAVAAGTDPVVLDAWAASLLGRKANSVQHLVLAQSRGLGTIHFKHHMISG
jgi:uncharacterized protein (DUF362 family)